MQKEKVVSFLYLKVFFILIVITILFAIFLRVFNEYQNSSFRYNYFSVLYLSTDTKLITVDKNGGTASFFSLGNELSELKGKSAFESSIVLGVPVDGVIISNSSPSNLNDFLSFESEKKLFVLNDKFLKGLNHYDIYKFINSLKNISKDNIKTGRINLANASDVASSSDFFKDSKVRQMPFTVEVVNGTNIDGLGNRVANILTLYGFNVVSVRNSSRNTPSFIQDENVDRDFIGPLKSLTNFKEVAGKYSPIADVAIFLGTDLEQDINQ